MNLNIIIRILIVFVVFFLIGAHINNNETPPFPIDVVYTWKGEETTDNVRTSYNYELQYSLRSIDLYAPWVNNIYILTDYPKKYPSWIKEDNNKIILIETTDTFPHPNYLPNSNSNAIESTITNIKNLSEHYIYFCDDIFLGKKTKYTDFFTYDGKAIVDKHILETRPILIDESNNNNDIKYPPSTGRMYNHIPIPQIKSIVKEFNEEYSDYIHWIRMTKNRYKKGFDVCQANRLNTPCQQIHYPICKYMYSKNKAIITDNEYPEKNIFIKNNNHKLLYELNRIIEIKPMFFCINDDQTDMIKREATVKMVFDFFEYYFTKKPHFEK